MPRWDGFGRTLLYALGSAAALPAAVVFLGPAWGTSAALGLYVWAAAGLYAWGVARGRRGRWAAAAGALGGALLAWSFSPGLAWSALGGAALVALCRGVIEPRQRRGRALAIELLLGGAGLGAAAFLASGGLRSLALATWGYFLVQSLYFLLGGRAGAGRAAELDRFEQARARLQQLLRHHELPG